MAQGNWELKISEGLRKTCLEKGAAMPRGSACQVIIEFAGTDARRIRALIQNHQGRVVREVGLVSGVVAEVPVAAIQPLAQSDLVKKIWSDSQVKIC